MAQPAGPRIGVTVPAHIPPGGFVPYVRRAEQLGFHEVWLVEDCFLHAAVLEFATDLVTLRNGTGSSSAFAAALPDAWVDRLAIVGPPGTAGAGAGAAPQRRRPGGADPRVPGAAARPGFAGLGALEVH